MQCFLLFPQAGARRSRSHGHTRTALMQCVSSGFLGREHAAPEHPEATSDGTKAPGCSNVAFPYVFYWKRAQTVAPGSDQRRCKGARMLICNVSLRFVKEAHADGGATNTAGSLWKRTQAVAPGSDQRRHKGARMLRCSVSLRFVGEAHADGGATNTAGSL